MSGPLAPTGGRSPYPGPFDVGMVPDLLNRFGALMEKYPTEFIDASWLPATKLIMIHAFKSAWLGTSDPEMRNQIEFAWVSLSWFQSGVGAHPIGCDITGMSIETASDLLNRFKELSAISEAEGETLLASLNAFKEGLQIETSHRRRDHPEGR